MKNNCVTKDDVCFDVCFDMNYSYTYYGVNINGIATVSTESYDDIYEMYGIDLSKYILGCFMLYDTTQADSKTTNVYRLDVEIERPGIIKPIFKGIE